MGSEKEVLFVWMFEGFAGIDWNPAGLRKVELGPAVVAVDLSHSTAIRNGDTFTSSKRDEECMKVGAIP